MADGMVISWVSGFKSCLYSSPDIRAGCVLPGLQAGPPCEHPQGPVTLTVLSWGKGWLRYLPYFLRYLLVQEGRVAAPRRVLLSEVCTHRNRGQSVET